MGFANYGVRVCVLDEGYKLSDKNHVIKFEQTSDRLVGLKKTIPMNKIAENSNNASNKSGES